MSSVGELSLATPSNTWELDILTGYAMSDTGSYSSISTDNDRKVKRITQAHLPVNWNFQTYIRPTGATLQHYANSTVNNTTVDGKARPVADWFMWQALVSNVEIGSESAWHHNLSTANVAASLSASSSTSKIKSAQENYIYFNADKLWYKVSNVVVNSAVLDASISDLATVTWSGLGTDMVEIAASNVVSNASNLSAEYSYHPFKKMNVAGEISTNSYISNMLSTLHFTVNANNYSFPVINFTFNYKNGIKYLSRKQINKVSVPIGQYTDSRDITGSATMYLRDTAFINELRSTTDATSNATIKIGNDMVISMSNVHFKIPSIAVSDAFTFTADFISEEVTEIEFPNAYSTADLTLDFENDVFFSSNKRKSMSDLLFAGRSELKNAWMPDGTIGWAGHNLLAYSEDFSRATWITSGASSSVDTLIESSSLGIHSCYVAKTIEAAQYTVSIEAKPKGRDWIFLRCSDSAVGVYFNIATGAIGTISAGYTATIVPTLGGYYKCSVTFTTSVDSILYEVYLASADNTNSYTGDGVSGVYLRKASMYRSDYGGMQLNNGDDYYKSGDILLPDNTFNAPAIAYDPITKVREGVVIEPAITRLNRQPICTVTNNGWASNSATYTNLSLNALGVFTGVQVISTGVSSSRIQLAAPNLTIGATYKLYAYYREGTSSSLSVEITNSTTPTLKGPVGNLVSYSSEYSNVTNRLLSDNVTYEVTADYTPVDPSGYFGLSPNSTVVGGDVIALGVFLQDISSDAPILSNIASSSIVGNDYIQIGRELGSTEYISNSGFNDRSAWVLGPNTVIEGRVARSSNTSNNTRIVAQDLPTNSLKYYNMTIDFISDNVVNFYVYDTYYTLLATLSNTNVSKDFIITDNYIDIQSDNTFNGYINNVSVKEWLPFNSFNSDKGTFVITAKVENDNSYILSSSANSYFVAKNLTYLDNATISSTISNYINSDYFTVTTTYDSNITIQAGSAATGSTSNSYITTHMAPTNGILQLGNLDNDNSAKGIIKKLEYYNTQK